MNYSLQRLLVILGLVIIPFYEIFLHALPFVRNIAPDSRAPKEILALVFALSIGLLAVFQGTIKPFKNKWLLFIPVYLLLNLIIAPHVDMLINGVESGDFYFWKPFVEVLCFTLMIISVASMEINFNSLLRIMVICGAVMAGYVVLQKLGFDQFWIVKEPGKHMGNWMGSYPNGEIGGNLGQSTIVASWLVMMVPLSIYLKKYWMAVLMVIACLLTKGAMVTMSLGFIGIIYLLKFNMKFIIPILFIGIAIGGYIISNHQIQQKILNRMDGRYEAWRDILSDIKNGQIENFHSFSITGIGLGRFPFMFPNRHKSDFQQAHNDSMEFTYNCGLVGLVLLLGGIYLMFQGALVNISPLCFSILLSFIAILFCSLGSFPFQLGAHQFYSAILVGLLHNKGVLNDS